MKTCILHSLTSCFLNLILIFSSFVLYLLLEKKACTKRIPLELRIRPICWACPLNGRRPCVPGSWISFGGPLPCIINYKGKTQKKLSYFLSGPATKALPPPLKLSGQKKDLIFFAASQSCALKPQFTLILTKFARYL